MSLSVGGMKRKKRQFGGSSRGNFSRDNISTDAEPRSCYELPSNNDWRGEYHQRRSQDGGPLDSNSAYSDVQVCYGEETNMTKLQNLLDGPGYPVGNGADRTSSVGEGNVPAIRIRGGGSSSGETGTGSDEEARMFLSISASLGGKVWWRVTRRKTSSFKQGVKVHQVLMDLIRDKTLGIEVDLSSDEASSDSRDNLVAINLSTAVDWSKGRVKLHRKPYLNASQEDGIELCEAVIATFEALTEELSDDDSRRQEVDDLDAQDETQLANLRAHMQELESDLTRTDAWSNDLERRINTLRDSLVDTKPSDDINQQLDSLKESVGDLQARLSDTNKFSADLEEQLQAASESGSRRSANTPASRQPLGSPPLKAVDFVPDSEILPPDEQLEALKAKMDNLQSQLDRANQVSDELEQRLRDLNESVEDAQQRHADADAYTQPLSTEEMPPASKSTTKTAPESEAGPPKVDDFTSAFSALSSAAPKYMQQTKEPEELSIDSSFGDLSLGDDSSEASDESAAEKPGHDVDDAGRQSPFLSAAEETSAASSKSFHTSMEEDKTSAPASAQRFASKPVAVSRGAPGNEDDTSLKTTSDLPSLVSSVSSDSFDQLWVEAPLPPDVPLDDDARDIRQTDSPEEHEQLVPLEAPEAPAQTRAVEEHADHSKEATGQEYEVGVDDHKAEDRSDASLSSAIQSEPRGQDEAGRKIHELTPGTIEKSEAPKGDRVEDFTSAFSALSTPKPKDDVALDQQSVDSSIGDISSASAVSDQDLLHEAEATEPVPEKGSPVQEKHSESDPKRAEERAGDEGVAPQKREPDRVGDFTEAFAALATTKSDATKAVDDNDSLDSSVQSISTAVYDSAMETEVEKGPSVGQSSALGSQPPAESSVLKEDRSLADKLESANKPGSGPIPKEGPLDSEPTSDQTQKVDDFTQAFSALSSPTKKVQATGDDEQSIDSSVGSIATASTVQDPATTPGLLGEPEHDASKGTEIAIDTTLQVPPKSEPSEATQTQAPSQQREQEEGDGDRRPAPAVEPSNKVDEFTQAFSVLNSPAPPKVQEVDDENSIDSSVRSISSVDTDSQGNFDADKPVLNQTQHTSGDQKKDAGSTEALRPQAVADPEAMPPSGDKMEPKEEVVPTTHEADNVTKTHEEGGKKPSEEPDAKVDEFTRAFSALSGPQQARAKPDESSDSIDSSYVSEVVPASLQADVDPQPSAVPTKLAKPQETDVTDPQGRMGVEATEEPDPERLDKNLISTTKTETSDPLQDDGEIAMRESKVDDFTQAFSALNNSPAPPTAQQQADDNSIDSSVGSIESAETEAEKEGSPPKPIEEKQDAQKKEEPPMTAPPKKEEKPPAPKQAAEAPKIPPAVQAVPKEQAKEVEKPDSKVDQFTQVFSTINKTVPKPNEVDDIDSVDSSVGSIESVSDADVGGGEDVAVQMQPEDKPGAEADNLAAGKPGVDRDGTLASSTGYIASVSANDPNNLRLAKQTEPETVRKDKEIFFRPDSSITDKMDALERTLQFEKDLVSSAERVLESLIHEDDLEDESTSFGEPNKWIQDDDFADTDDRSVALSVEVISVALSSSSGSSSETDSTDPLMPRKLEDLDEKGEEGSGVPVEQTKEPQQAPRYKEPPRQWPPVAPEQPTISDLTTSKENVEGRAYEKEGEKPEESQEEDKQEVNVKEEEKPPLAPQLEVRAPQSPKQITAPKRWPTVKTTLPTTPPLPVDTKQEEAQKEADLAKDAAAEEPGTQKAGPPARKWPTVKTGVPTSRQIRQGDRAPSPKPSAPDFRAVKPQVRSRPRQQSPVRRVGAKPAENDRLPTAEENARVKELQDKLAKQNRELEDAKQAKKELEAEKDRKVAAAESAAVRQLQRELDRQKRELEDKKRAMRNLEAENEKQKQALAEAERVERLQQELEKQKSRELEERRKALKRMEAENERQRRKLAEAEKIKQLQEALAKQNEELEKTNEAVKDLEAANEKQKHALAAAKEPKPRPVPTRKSPTQSPRRFQPTWQKADVRGSESDKTTNVPSDEAVNANQLSTLPSESGTVSKLASRFERNAATVEAPVVPPTREEALAKETDSVISLEPQSEESPREGQQILAPDEISEISFSVVTEITSPKHAGKPPVRAAAPTPASKVVGEKPKPQLKPTPALTKPVEAPDDILAQEPTPPPPPVKEPENTTRDKAQLDELKLPALKEMPDETAVAPAPSDPLPQAEARRPPVDPIPKLALSPEDAELLNTKVADLLSVDIVLGNESSSIELSLETLSTNSSEELRRNLERAARDEEAANIVAEMLESVTEEEPKDEVSAVPGHEVDLPQPDTKIVDGLSVADAPDDELDKTLLLGTCDAQSGNNEPDTGKSDLDDGQSMPGSAAQDKEPEPEATPLEANPAVSSVVEASDDESDAKPSVIPKTKNVVESSSDEEESESEAKPKEEPKPKVVLESSSEEESSESEAQPISKPKAKSVLESSSEEESSESEAKPIAKPKAKSVLESSSEEESSESKEKEKPKAKTQAKSVLESSSEEESSESETETKPKVAAKVAPKKPTAQTGESSSEESEYTSEDESSSSKMKAAVKPKPGGGALSIGATTNPQADSGAGDVSHEKLLGNTRSGLDPEPLELVVQLFPSPDRIKTDQPEESGGPEVEASAQEYDDEVEQGNPLIPISLERETATTDSEDEDDAPRNFLNEFTKDEDDPEGYKPDNENYSDPAENGSNLSVISINSELTASSGDFDPPLDATAPPTDEAIQDAEPKVNEKDAFAMAFSAISAAKTSTLDDNQSVSVDSSKRDKFGTTASFAPDDGSPELTEEPKTNTASKSSPEQSTESPETEQTSADNAKHKKKRGKKKKKKDKKKKKKQREEESSSKQEFPYDEVTDLSPSTAQEEPVLVKERERADRFDSRSHQHDTVAQEPQHTEHLDSRSRPRDPSPFRNSAPRQTRLQQPLSSLPPQSSSTRLSNVDDAFERLNRLKDRLKSLKVLMDTKDQSPESQEVQRLLANSYQAQQEGGNPLSGALADFTRELQLASERNQNLATPSPIDEAYGALLRAQSKLRSLRALAKGRKPRVVY